MQIVQLKRPRLKMKQFSLSQKDLKIIFGDFQLKMI